MGFSILTRRTIGILKSLMTLTTSNQNNLSIKKPRNKERRARLYHNPATILPQSEQNPGKIIVKSEHEYESEYEDPNKKEVVPGKTKISEFVHLSDVEREDVLMEFKRFGLEWKHVERACVHLDRWLAEPLNASKRRYAPLHLKTWGLKEVMKDQATKNDLGASENRRKGIRPSADPPRPRSKTVDEIMQEQLGKI